MGKAATFWRAVVLGAAVVFMGIGAARSHKVYEGGDEEFGVMVFQRISEAQLVEYATFSGAYVQGGRLHRHEWAAQQDGKQKCPT